MGEIEWLGRHGWDYWYVVNLAAASFRSVG